MPDIKSRLKWEGLVVKMKPAVSTREKSVNAKECTGFFKNSKSGKVRTVMGGSESESEL